MIRFVAIALILAGCAFAASAHELRIDGDRISIKARNAPLQDILADFVQAGVSVKIDPDINTRVTGNVRDMDIDEALEEMLRPYGYALIWDVVPGPLGDLTRLAEIQVYRRDKPRNLEPFRPENNFRISRGATADGAEFVANEILIALKAGTNVEQFKLLLAQLGGSVIGSIPELGIYRIRLPAGTNVLALIEQLKNNAIVSRVEPNFAYKLPEGSLDPEAVSAEAKPGAASVNPGVPPVAVLDSGLRMLSALNNLVVGSYDAILPDRTVDDTKGHGTQMALIASGAVAPNGVGGAHAGVPVIGIRAFDDNGYTSSYTLMRAIEYAADQGARVVNLSWGTETPSSFLETSIRQAQSRGMIVVASAGNTPNGKQVYPASFPGVVSVSALKANGNPWESSNYGSSVDFAAPGTASFPVGHDGPPGGYAGTSIASAYVAHTLALYLGQNPKATANQAVKALGTAASPAPSGPENYGSGTLDGAAVSRLLGP